MEHQRLQDTIDNRQLYESLSRYWIHEKDEITTKVEFVRILNEISNLLSYLNPDVISNEEFNHKDLLDIKFFIDRKLEELENK